MQRGAGRARVTGKEKRVTGGKKAFSAVDGASQTKFNPEEGKFQCCSRSCVPLHYAGDDTGKILLSLLESCEKSLFCVKWYLQNS